MMDIHALSGAYAVDAVDDVERARFERHLDGCEDCRAEVASLRETAVLISGTVTQPPPGALLERVLAEVATVRPLAPVVHLHPRTATTRRRRAPLLAAAAVTALVVGVGGATTWNALRDQPIAGQRQLTVADQVLASPDAVRHEVSVTGGGRVVMVNSRAMAKAAMVTRGLTALPTGRVYELWLQDPKGVMMPAGLLDTHADQTVLFEGDSTEATGAGITIEPAGGSDVPTTNPIALTAFEKDA